MGRPERPLDPASGPRQLFAGQLRRLREQAGWPTYRAMAEVTDYSAPALSRAAAGERFPTIEVTLAFVRACGGDEEEWRLRWQRAQAELMPAPREPAGAREGAAHNGTTDHQAPRDAASPGASPPVTAPSPVGGRVSRAARRGWPRPLAVALWQNRLAALLTVCMTGVLINLALAVHAASQSARYSATAPVLSMTGLRPLDGTDPYIGRCGSDQVRLEQRTWPIYWPDGRLYGRLALYHSSACRASWGYVYGPNSPAWTVVITARRQGQNPASTPASFRGAAPPNSWGNLLSDRTGCVRAEAYVVAAAGHRGPTAMTSCWQESGPVYRGP